MKRLIENTTSLVGEPGYLSRLSDQQLAAYQSALLEFQAGNDPRGHFLAESIRYYQIANRGNAAFMDRTNAFLMILQEDHDDINVGVFVRNELLRIENQLELNVASFLAPVPSQGVAGPSN